MMHLRLAPSLLVLSLLAACESKPADTVAATTIAGPGGVRVDTPAVDDAGMAAPADLPKWALRYPGSKVVGVVNAGGSKVVAISVAAPVAKVIAAYDTDLARTGIKPTTSSNFPDSGMRSFGTGLTAGTILFATGDVGTDVSVTYRPAG